MTPNPWVGWAKAKGQRWWPICRELTEAAAWQALLEMPHCDSKAVLPDGQTPWRNRWWARQGDRDVSAIPEADRAAAGR